MKQYRYNNNMNKISTVCQPAQWNPETSRQDLIYQTFKRKRQGKVISDLSIFVAEFKVLPEVHYGHLVLTLPMYFHKLADYVLRLPCLVLFVP